MQFEYTDRFVDRHIGPSTEQSEKMLRFLGLKSLEDLVRATVPQAIQMKRALELPLPLSEFEALQSLKKTASSNQIFKTYLGMGYSDTITPPVIQRNILENPGWYTQYTPYQAEIAQGRLEALLNFQTLICDLTGFEISNASLLDESTAAAEAMAMAFAMQNRDTTKALILRSRSSERLSNIRERTALFSITALSFLKFTRNKLWRLCQQTFSV
jgi:glycine dehydrogenase